MLYIYRLQNGSFASGVWGPVRGSLSLYRDTDRSRSNYQAGGDRYRWKNKNNQFCLLRINLHEKCSYKEGFRFKSSDLDAMIWYTKHKVICDISQFKFSYPLNIDFVLIDHSDTFRTREYEALISKKRFVTIRDHTPSRHIKREI